MKQSPRKSPPRKLKKVKRLEKEARAISKGTTLGEYDAHGKKPLLESLKEHLGHWIDNINPIDLVAIIAGTIIIKPIIHESDTLLKRVDIIANTFVPLGKSIEHMAVTKPSPESAAYLATEITQLAGAFGFLGTPTSVKEGFAPDWAEWLVSFFCAYIIVKYGGQLIGLLDKGMTSVVPMLLGVV